MLDYLRVENFAVVEKAQMHFSPHLNVLTGETGAGKSILIGAVNLFLKKKVADNAIRGEDNRLLVEAMFSQGEEELILRREISRNRSICFLNGDMVPFSQLKEIAEKLLNIYSQNEHIYLLNPANHRIYLDEFSQDQQELLNLSQGYAHLNHLVSQLTDLKKKKDKAGETLDFINFQLEEIDNLKMEKGDDTHLEQRLLILSSAEEILSRAHQLSNELHQNDGSVYNIIAQNLDNMEYLKHIYPGLEILNEEMLHFYNLLPELSSSISNIIGGVDFSEEELNDIEDKLHRINRLKTKYKMNLDQLLDKRDRLKEERELYKDMNFSIQEKEKEINKGLEIYKELNTKLREKLKKKAHELGKLVEKELAKLEMSKAKFQVQIEEQEPGLDNLSERGTDKVEFYFTSNPGQPLGRIRDIASGGELSRLMLVLKSILRDEEDATYIFDEVDAGIGGKTAEFVGEKLQRIAENHQVICISHLPQIASFADVHFLVTKEFKKNQTFSYVQELSEEEKAREIGRLMVGSEVDGDVLKAAQRLLEKNRK